MTFSANDKKFMKIALKQAKISLNHMDHPVGAVLTIDGKMVGVVRNKLNSKKDWASHAEAELIKQYSGLIMKQVKEHKSNVTLYATLEPCLMCLGTAILHKVTRIVYACPDPHGGATRINPKNLTAWYVKHWPVIEGGLYREESYNLVCKLFKVRKSHSDAAILKLFEDMKKKWK